MVKRGFKNNPVIGMPAAAGVAPSLDAGSAGNPITSGSGDEKILQISVINDPHRQSIF